ncbi:hypothetical protein [Stenotrophomonas sp. AS1]|uniref:hypothetical protein n=1 Tax=Stenotrophomonas sp. AS1 TaxID=3029188 RepID=UPI003B80B75D
MNTERTEKFVNAIACDLEEGGFRQVSGTTLRRTLATAVSAALPLLADVGIPASQPAELAEQQGVSLPAFPRTYYDAFGDGSEPLYTGKQMQDYARAALAATGKQQVGEPVNHAAEIARKTRSALEFGMASLGKQQQVGEVQGDAREQFETWADSIPLNRARFVPENVYCDERTKTAWSAWQAALAARQPGAVE